MATLELHGRINSSGQRELDLPPGLPEGDIIVRLEVPQPERAIDPNDHWGRRVLARLNELDLSAWEALEMPDVMDWVQTIRDEQDARLKRFWDGLE